MKALVVREYGGPECLQLGDHPDPEPGPGDVLVRPALTGLNPIDGKMRQGLLRSTYPVVPPFVIGREFCGRVVAAGEGVNDYRPGDRVFGAAAHLRDGAHAELVATPAELIAPQPEGLADEVAAVPGNAEATPGESQELSSRSICPYWALTRPLLG